MSGDVVLDNTMWSGSAGVASIKLNRDFIGIELDKHYYEIAKKELLMLGAWIVKPVNKKMKLWLLIRVIAPTKSDVTHASEKPLCM